MSVQNRPRRLGQFAVAHAVWTCGHPFGQQRRVGVDRSEDRPQRLGRGQDKGRLPSCQDPSQGGVHLPGILAQKHGLPLTIGDARALASDC